MRVTERQIFDRATRASDTARSDLQRATDQLSSGRRVTRPFDDPAAASRMIRLQAQSDRADAIAGGVAAARDELDFVDGALGNVENVLVRAKEVAMTYANDSLDAAAKARGADEVAGLVRELTGLLNQKFGERFVFAGDLSDTAPFQADGTYVGDGGVRKVEVGLGVEEDVSVRADVVFKGAAGGVDLFQALADLQAALGAGDTTAIRASIGGLDDGLSQVSDGRSRVGATTTILNAAEVAAQTVSLSARGTTARLGEVDVVDAATKLQAAQTALEASLKATKGSFSMTLLAEL